MQFTAKYRTIESFVFKFTNAIAIETSHKITRLPSQNSLISHIIGERFQIYFVTFQQQALYRSEECSVIDDLKNSTQLLKLHFNFTISIITRRTKGGEKLINDHSSTDTRTYKKTLLMTRKIVGKLAVNRQLFSFSARHDHEVCFCFFAVRVFTPVYRDRCWPNQIGVYLLHVSIFFTIELDTVSFLALFLSFVRFSKKWSTIFDVSYKFMDTFNETIDTQVDQQK